MNRCGFSRGSCATCCWFCHAQPKNAEHAETWKKLVENTLESPDTREVALSAGKDKRENWDGSTVKARQAEWPCCATCDVGRGGVPPKLIAERLEKGIARALPFRFVTAARNAPKLEEAIEKAMLRGIARFEMLAGVTGLATLLREKAEEFCSATFF